jgi:hypothetical protein
MILAGLTLGRNHLHLTRNGNELKCTSVPDFRCTKCSLQVGRVKWTSPRHWTHSFDSLHLGVKQTSWNRERWRTIRYTAKVKLGRERPHPLTHRASRVQWGRSRPRYAVHVRRSERRTTNHRRLRQGHEVSRLTSR